MNERDQRVRIHWGVKTNQSRKQRQLDDLNESHYWSNLFCSNELWGIKPITIYKWTKVIKRFNIVEWDKDAKSSIKYERIITVK